MSAPEIINPGAASGGAPVGGSGTPGKLAKFTGAGTSIGDSVVTELTGKIGINVVPGTLLSVGDGIVSPPSYDGIRLGNTAEALFSSSDSIRGFRAGVTGATVVAGSTTSHDLLLQRGNVTALTLGASGAVTFAGNLTSSSAAQTWTLAAGTSALNIASNLLNLDTTNSRVGIGTASPQEKLQVYGDLKVGVLASGSYISLGDEATTNRLIGIFRAPGDTLLGVGGYAGIKFTVGAASLGSQTERMRIDATGNVGIGTASPVAGGLTVYGASNGQVFVQNSSGHSRLLQNSTDFYIDGNVSGSAGSIIFRRGSGTLESARIDSSGNVGIGTASPTALLEVKGSSGNLLALTNGGVNKLTVTSAGSCSAAADFTASSGFGAGGWATFWGSSSGGVGLGSGNLIGWDAATTHPGYSVTGYDTTLSRNAAGVLQVGTGTTGNALGTLAAAGVKLPATPGNTNPNTLDCYDETDVSSGYTLSGVTTTSGAITVAIRATRIGRTMTFAVSIAPAGGASLTFAAAWYLTMTGVSAPAFAGSLAVSSNDVTVTRGTAWVNAVAAPTVYGSAAALGANVSLFLNGTI